MYICKIKSSSIISLLLYCIQLMYHNFYSSTSVKSRLNLTLSIPPVLSMGLFLINKEDVYLLAPCIVFLSYLLRNFFHVHMHNMGKNFNIKNNMQHIYSYHNIMNPAPANWNSTRYPCDSNYMKNVSCIKHL